ncbi:MAG: RNA 3'-terminal phosphate cyclase [Nanoarchaeota archaeon]
MISLDGSFGEGGGQIIRTALGLSVLTNQAFEVLNIRTSRPLPGLKPQHLAAIRTLQEISCASVIGAKEGSLHLIFKPEAFQPRDIIIDVGTAGSITLVLQALLLPILFGGKHVNLKIRGGTDVKWSMPFDYVKEVLVPHLQKYAQVECNLHRRGYYPKGNGLVELNIKPRFTLTSLKDAPHINTVKRNKLIMIRGVSHASIDLQNKKVTERQTYATKITLKDLGVPIEIREEYHYTASPGFGISLFAYFGKDEELDEQQTQIIGADALGEREKSAEQVGTEAAMRLLKELHADAPIDSHLADNLVPLLGLIGNALKTTTITSHTQTNVYVTNQFLNNCLVIDHKNSTISKRH